MNDLIDSVKTKGDMRLNGDPIYGRSVDVIELRNAWAWCFRSRTRFR